MDSMSYFGRFSLVAAYRDLRLFLATRERYEVGFFALAVAITGSLVYAFVLDSRAAPPPYEPHIIYVKDWRADRTDGEIKAQQVVDEAARKRRAAAEAAEREKTRAEFQRLDNTLSNMGI